MSILSQKSEDSYKSAIILIEQKYYPNSIQCSYFSSLQLAKDNIIKDVSDIEEFERKLSDDNTSHFEIIRLASDKIRLSKREKGVLRDLLTRMKRTRKNAIYGQSIFNEDAAFEVLNDCKKANRILNK